MFNLSIISIEVLENVFLPDARLQKRASFSTLIVGPAMTGDRTWTTCVAGSGASRSAAILYNLPHLCFKQYFFHWANVTVGKFLSGQMSF
jgi:hypothetical protein